MAKNALTKQGGLSIPGMKLTPTGIIFNGKVWTKLLAAAAGADLAFYSGLILEACGAVEKNQ